MSNDFYNEKGPIDLTDKEQADFWMGQCSGLSFTLKEYRFIIDAKNKKVKALKAKNVDLEKQNEMLAHQLKYAESILTEVQADKYKLREKLAVAVEALEHLSIGNNLSLSNRDALLKFIADREAVSNEALEKIKGASNG